MIRCIITVDGGRYSTRIDEGEGGDEIVTFGGTIEPKDLTVDGREWRGEFPVPELIKFIKGLKIVVKMLRVLARRP